MSAVPGWNPDSHPVHRLIQLLDILVVGFERYQEYANNEEQHTINVLRQAIDNMESDPNGVLYRQRLAESRRSETQLVQIRDRIKGGNYAHHLHDRLVVDALSYVVNRGVKADTAEPPINRAANAVVQLCWEQMIGSSHRRDFGPHAPDLMVKECQRMADARFARQDLIRLLPRIGENLPPEIIGVREFGEDLLAEFPRGLGEDPTTPPVVAGGGGEKPLAAVPPPLPRPVDWSLPMSRTKIGKKLGCSRNDATKRLNDMNIQWEEVSRNRIRVTILDMTDTMRKKFTT
jgi:hypothetical protein